MIYIDFARSFDPKTKIKEEGIMAKENPPLKIISLESENFKRLRAISIKPDGNMVTISGRNEQGKTSVLDSIWAALAGADALKDTPQPIRKGEKAARVRVDLGDLVVTRAWTEKGTYLKVENADGMEYKSPQALLDRFLGKLSFDPLAFSSMKSREQRETLLGLLQISLDLDEWARERQEAYDQRTILNRKVKEYEAQIAGLPEVPGGTPDEEVSAATVLEEQAAAQKVKEENDARRRELKDGKESLVGLDLENERALSLIVRLKKELEEAILHQKSIANKLTFGNKNVQGWEKEVAKLIDPDLTGFAAKLAEVETTNRQVRVKQQKEKFTKEMAQYDEAIMGHNQRITELDQAKVQALQAATFPIDGLAFDDEGVTYKGIPFSQCSAAERLRVSLAMAMALNPTIRVLRITDGSLLDNDNLRVVQEMVEAKGYQLWIEKVANDGGVGIVIEDGMVKEVE
jgi:hypothetical protein